MMDIQAATFERMRQAVGRLIRDGAGDALNGEIVLRVVDGELVDVRLPGGGYVVMPPTDRLVTDAAAESAVFDAQNVQDAEDEMREFKQRKSKGSKA